MDIRVLQYFLAVVREENITKAAQLLHITQPTLSRQLMGLEQELGVKLFSRNNHSVTLTEEGMLFRRRAEEIVTLSEMTKRELKQEAMLTGEISIGSGEYHGSCHLSGILAAFRAEHPNVTYSIIAATPITLRSALNAARWTSACCWSRWKSASMIFCTSRCRKRGTRWCGRIRRWRRSRI